MLVKHPLEVAQFQSTLPARGATQQSIDYFTALLISIHAPRTGSDQALADLPVTIEISIHAPRTGSDQPWEEKS